MNTITNNVIRKLTQLEKKISTSEKELERYENMISQLKQYAKTRYGYEFVISHVTINYLKGTIKAQKAKRDLLKDCLNYDERQLLKQQLNFDKTVKTE